MHAWEERVIEQQAARAEGKSEGVVEGQRQLNMLNLKLIEAGRMDDLIRATKDAAFLEELFREFQIS